MLMRVLAWPAFRNRKDNPYNFLLYTHLKRLGVTVLDLGDVLRSPRQLVRSFLRRVDILHVHWPEYALSLPPFRFAAHVFILFAVGLYIRLRGGKVVWTVHNLAPHERRYPFLEKWFYRAFSYMTDGLIFLTQTSLALFLADSKMRPFLGKPAVVIPHGHYLPVYPARVGKEEARKLLGLPLDKKIILFLGALRPYKGVEELIVIARQFPIEETIFLIAGKPLSEDYKRKLIRMTGNAPHIWLQAEYVHDDKVPLLYSAADVAIFPYKDILNSGSVFLSLSFGIPVIVPKLGSLIELAERYPSLVYTYEPPLTEKKLLELMRAVEFSGSERKREWEKYIFDFDWEKIAESTLRFYRDLKRGISK